LISGTVAAGDAANGPYTVTVTATDTQGYSSAQQFLWNANPSNLDPVVTNPGSQINTQGDVLSLQVQATDPAGNGLTYSATGLPPGLTIDADSGLISGVLSSNSASGSPYNVTVTATDGSYSGSAAFTWSVTNQAVTVMNPGTQSGTGGSPVSLQINASDPAQLPLTYAAVGLPEGATINASSGLISGTLDSSAGGAYAVTVMASDSQGNSGSVSFTWNVTYLNQAPTLDNPGDQLDHAGDVVSLQLSGYDVDGDTVTYSATGLPSGLSLDQTTGIISGTLPASAGASTPYSVTVTASDGTLTASQTFNWFVTGAPVTLTSPGDQTNSEGDVVSLQLSANGSGLTYRASGLPSGLSLNTSTGLISGTVASGDAANGPYTATVTATDTQGHSSAQQFTWNVNVPANSLTLTNPGHQSNAESDNVSLQVQASDPDGDTLEYAASGLPIGLLIDPTTGLISGTVDYSAAEISGGQYHVIVTVDDGNGQTISQSFVWTIADAPQAPWLQYPEFQDSQTNTSASLQLVGGSPDGKALSYSATGLPAGLSVNPTTGIISGTITAAPGSYTVTATVTDTSNLTASQTFTWQVTSGSAPQVLLSFDGEPVGDDYLAGVDPATPIPVLVTLVGATPGSHTISLSIPSGKSAVSQSTFQLADGGSETIELTPEEESQAFDDVLLVAYVDGKEAADAEGTNPKVTIAGKVKGGDIRNTDTPGEMKDNRIPPMDPSAETPWPITQVAVTITPTLKDAKVVQFRVIGNSDANGAAALVNIYDKVAVVGVYLQQSKDLRVVGKAQTTPSMTDGKPDGKGSNAGKLIIVAYPGTKDGDTDTKTELASSAGFSVAAIPTNYVVKYEDTKVMKKENIGIRVKDAWRSDNQATQKDSVPALDQVQISEVLSNPVTQTGIFKDEPFNFKTSDYLDATKFSVDEHSVSQKLVVAPGGTLVVEQLSKFKDMRTGAVDVPVPFSGYEITYRVYQEKGKWMLEVTKKGKSVTIKDPKTGTTLTSEAGFTIPEKEIKQLGGNG
jgi:hypothetical protein